MRLRLACDLDGTIADMDAALQREAEALFGPDVDLRGSVPLPDTSGEAPTSGGEIRAEPPAPNERRPLTRRELAKLWEHVRTVKNFWLSLPETEPDVVRRFGELAKAHAWEVIFLTRRPSTAGLSSQLQSQMWLRRLGFRLPSVFVLHGSRGKVAASLGLNLVIDDRVENCLDVIADSQATPVLVWRARREAVPAYSRSMGIEVVGTVTEVLDRLVAGTLQPSERAPGAPSSSQVSGT